MTDRAAQNNSGGLSHPRPKCRHNRNPDKPCPYCTVTQLSVNWESVLMQSGEHPAVAQLVDLTNGGRFPLRGFRFRIGRENTNHIEVKDIGASRAHAIITYEEGHYFLDDLGSTNGTLLNGRLVTRREKLSQGDVLKIGKTCFGFYLDLDDHKTDPVSGSYFSTTQS